MKLTGLMKILLGACIIVAIAVAYPASQREAALIWDKTVAIYGAERQISKADPGYFARADYESSTMPAPDLTYLADYAYSEVPPDEKPADTVLKWLSATPVGTPIEEIIRASEAFGLDESFMVAVARIESGFDPNERTGSYIGLFQLSHYEFDKYGAGDIVDARDNAIAAAYKFTTAAIMFELVTHKKPTLSDLYLIHQQGTQGAAEHVSHPDRIAWESMCATDEGREKGEKWCKRAIWANTLPDIKKIAKSVDKLTSGDFVQMWRSRVAEFYSYYTAAMAAK
jgi:hypothetical protein